MLEQPQRHRDTEEAQSHPPILSNAKAQRRKDAKSIHLPGFQRRGAETQRRRGDLTGFLRVARFRPSNGREPLGRATAPNTSVHLGVPAQRLALIKRKPRHFSSSFNSWERHALLPNNEREERQNRRASGTSAGEKAGCDDHSRSEQTVVSPATGDPRSPVDLPPKSAITFQAQHPPLCVGGRVGGLCAFVSLCLRRGWVGALRLCVFAPLRFFLCVPLCVSVPLWFFDHRISRIV